MKNIDIILGYVAAFIIMILSFTGVTDNSTTTNAILGVLIIVLIVSMNNRKDFKDTIENLKEHQLSYVLGGMVPESIFEHIRDHIVRNCFLRTGCFVNISLKDIGDGFMEVRFRDRYKVRNLSNSPSQYQIKGIIEKEFGYKIDKNRFESLSIIQSGKTDMYSGDSLKTYLSETENTVKLNKTLILEGNEEIEITTKRIKIQRDTDSNYWKPPQVSDSLTVNVSHPENFEVYANSFHPSEAPLLVLVNDIDEKTWKINEGVLPYQGINITWKKSNKAVQH